MVSIPIPAAFLFGLAAVAMRVGFLVAFMPICGERFTPVRVRILLAVALSMVLAPVVAPQAASVPGSLPEFFVGLLPEALLGMALGLIGRIILSAIQFSGQFAGRSMGFAFANDVDPASRAQMTAMAHIQYAMAALLFLVSNAHLAFFSALGESFQVIAPFEASVAGSLAESVGHLGSRLFYLGLKLNFPIIGTIICVNLILALAARAAPGINILVETFPIRILIGLLVLGFAMTFLGSLMMDSFAEMKELLSGAVQLMRQ